jgi:hypothetical protein
MSKMPPVVKPYIGMPVWFWPSTAMSSVMRMAYDDTSKPMAAIIVYAWHDSMCNIVATDHRGHIHAITSVTFVPPGQRPDEGRDFCEIPTSQLMPPALQSQQPAEAWPVPAGHEAPPAPATATATATAREFEISYAVTELDVIEHTQKAFHINALQAIACSQPEPIAEAIRSALKNTDLCILVMRNGHTIIGASHCLDQSTYLIEKGREIAQRRALEKARDLLAYERRTEMAALASNSN